MTAVARATEAETEISMRIESESMTFFMRSLISFGGWARQAE
jgi:hypothetical protein